MQRQSSVAGLALQDGVHRPLARPSGYAPGRNVGVSLERQLDDVEPVPYKDFVAMLRDVAERTKEVIPVQHCSVVIHVRRSGWWVVPSTPLACGFIGSVCGFAHSARNRKGGVDSVPRWIALAAGCRPCRPSGLWAYLPDTSSESLLRNATIFRTACSSAWPGSWE